MNSSCGSVADINQLAFLYHTIYNVCGSYTHLLSGSSAADLFRASPLSASSDAFSLSRSSLKSSSPRPSTEHQRQDGMKYMQEHEASWQQLPHNAAPDHLNVCKRRRIASTMNYIVYCVVGIFRKNFMELNSCIQMTFKLFHHAHAVMHGASF